MRWNGRFFSTCFYTGMREQEICYLAWDDVDLKKKILRVSAKPDQGFTPKTWEERDIEISRSPRRLLQGSAAYSPLGVRTVRGKRHAHIYKIVERVAARAGIRRAPAQVPRHLPHPPAPVRLRHRQCPGARRPQEHSNHPRYLGVSTQLRREAVNRLNLPDTKQGETLEKVKETEKSSTG